ncbi:hypothetical protein BST61_g10156 [Cercospora zeina]
MRMAVAENKTSHSFASHSFASHSFHHHTHSIAFSSSHHRFTRTYTADNMKSYLFATAALLGAIANGAVIRRQGSGSGSGSGTLPCGATSSTTYTVKSGDTLTSIGKATGAGICDIAKASNVQNVNLISPGQVLTIPQGCTSPQDNTSCLTAPTTPATETCVAGLPSAYIVASGDTFTSIAGDFNITLGALEGANSQVSDPNSINVGQVINVPVCPNSQCDSVGTYSIAKGDLFYDLANNYHTTVGALKALNPTVNVTDIQVGQQIILPKNCHNITSS